MWLVHILKTLIHHRRLVVGALSMLLSILPGTVHAGGVAVLKEQSFHRDSTATPVVYLRIIDSHGPYLRIVTSRGNVDIHRSKLADYIEDVEGGEILSMGSTLELIKDLGDATVVSEQYGLGKFKGTHGIGHTRMATESDVDIRSAHPYWAYPFDDVSVVHNGQLTNYWTSRRAMERRGHRFVSNCDSELIAVYIADSIDRGDDLEEAMTRSITELDGVFTYLVATSDKLGMAKDTMAAKPMVLYESDDFIAMASEEVAIRSIFPHEIDTFDPYEGEVRVWQS